MSKYKDLNWNLESSPANFDTAKLSVLMDIRGELRKLNQLLHCDNFKKIPRKLDRISANTYRPKKRKSPTT